MTEPVLGPAVVDPFVQRYLFSTNGQLYKKLVGRLTEYPVPHLRLPSGAGELFLDIGCGWGRWSVAASRQGYRSLGVDASLDCVLAAERVAAQLGADAAFVVGSLSALPVRSRIVDGVVFSYSVLQHFDREIAVGALHEMGRVSKPDATVLVQFANRFGVRQLFNQLRMKFGWRRGEFEMRYWRPSELRRLGADIFGSSEVEVDGFFSVNPQPGDLRMLPLQSRVVVAFSEFLRRGPSCLVAVADSIYLRATAR